MNNNPQPECPECEKLSAVADKSNEIGFFLDWLHTERNTTLCHWDEETRDFYPVYSNPEKLLAEYFEIDLNKVEMERRALIQWLREQHND